jgi:PTS system nitrogen regulatory IIA component
MRNIGFIRPGAVICSLESRDKYHAIHELIRKAPVFQGIGNLDEFEQAVINRERIMSTAFGHGVAVAHGRSSSLQEFTIALGISHQGILFDSPDKEPVNLLFVVANPPDMHEEYLFALSSIVKHVRKKRFRDELLSCVFPEQAERKLACMLSL